MRDRRHIDGISCLCEGKLDGGNLLVLLHGIGSNAGSFVPLMEQLTERMSLLAWDAPGYGTSQPIDASWPTATDFAERLSRVLDHVGVNACTLLGHSLGAIVAGRFAALHPQRVSQLVLVSPALGYGTAPGASLARTVAQRVNDLSEEGPETFAAKRASRLVHRPAERPLVLAAVRDAMSRVTPGRYTSAARLLSCSDLIGDASRIQVPTLVAVGGEDQVTSPPSCRRMHDELVRHSNGAPRRFEEIADAGHAVCQERPEAVAQLIEQMIEKGGA